MNPSQSTEMKKLGTPHLTRRDPSLLTAAPIPPSIATSSGPKPMMPLVQVNVEPEEESRCTKFKRYLYNREKRTYCDRTGEGWAAIVAYSIMYLIFLSTYTMIFLYFSLQIIKSRQDFSASDLAYLSALTYTENDIGLTATPTSENSFPLIWYRNGERNDFDKYVSALDTLLAGRHLRGKREVRHELGPCGQHPYGYGDKPCVIIRINKQFKWSAKPLQPDSPRAKEAPDQVQKWLKSAKNKYWLHCDGYHSYDKEHIGKIRYYPDPPGFDADLFPLDVKGVSPLVAVQISNFTEGISLAVECKLWYENGISSLEFMLFVAPKGKIAFRKW